jgi:hypothetical protein
MDNSSAWHHVALVTIDGLEMVRLVDMVLDGLRWGVVLVARRRVLLLASLHLVRHEAAHLAVVAMNCLEMVASILAALIIGKLTNLKARLVTAIVLKPLYAILMELCWAILVICVLSSSLAFQFSF